MPVPREVSADRLERWQRRRKQVGARIRELRTQRGLTQEALALESGLDRTMVIYVEWGRNGLSYERLWDIAEALGVDVSDLLIPSRTEPQRRVFRGGRRATTRLEDGPKPGHDQ
ncbi:helix-turn-helix domain-containing protein [Sinomonas atrocyanea]|uniref:helix-turn-helix domain-containing protein n=1 Tax=Sinomonas atrocyanea TaxID=37927 RepID=UPI00278B2169|nr:helix-turn-helix transcriptional regulator [Sinomonas atrocyanea]MDQ0259545.1 transcriptional regulator with XRE-family HTH domain [Sinomonas atrocyanea]MDR6623196.1 transcriptional regulator with XRE-family HTH domain [Sinomonas atrocyanea]